MKNKIFKILMLLVFFTVFSCSRADENADVLSQEDISNIILNVKEDATNTVKTYNYAVNSVTNPQIQLSDGKIYTVSIIFKNGNEDVTQEIIAAKDEHFLLFSFISSNITLTRIDGGNDLRSDGKRVGLLTKWQVTKAVNGTSPQLILTLNHAANSVNESQNGTTFGSAQGGETDAVANYNITN